MSSFCTHIFFSKKFQHICVSLDVNFNESLTNDVVSFEQLGPTRQELTALDTSSYLQGWTSLPVSTTTQVVKTSAKQELTALDTFPLICKAVLALTLKFRKSWDFLILISGSLGNQIVSLTSKHLTSIFLNSHLWSKIAIFKLNNIQILSKFFL